ncbi:hypothetical protein SYNTR_1379 [Candidatus Syntrophocurvum alkaliphilum]|uniref:LysM domain-containing protein n=1 Tax=Candidatus Syntrophocurvum alkaliphilum TaxID=2293317 RepID=A0A6I6DGF9_9FIRM|nr:peptidoglycan-binding protein [Candidatus Syntrophocurvum alkaliphilum]QGT99972.1 hypothetical protein SYNTR_1379 [Candidatus Syntrophocurvum alkaliphilum]
MLIKNKKIIAIVTTLIFILSSMLIANPVWANYGDRNLYWGVRGDDVKNVQRDLTNLGYNTYGIDGVFGANTHDAVVSFQRDNDLPTTGVVASMTKNALNKHMNNQNTVHTTQRGDTLFKIAMQYGTSVDAIMQANSVDPDNIYPGIQIVIPNSSNTSTSNPSRGASRYGEYVDWWSVVDSTWTIGGIATITDLDTGISFQARRYGGGYHADVEPLTAADTEKLRQIYGGQWSWARKAVLVTTNGRTFAGSMNGMPHAQQAIWDNNFNGHFCVHFLNSRTHGTNRVCPNHQAMVRKAAGR